MCFFRESGILYIYIYIYIYICLYTCCHRKKKNNTKFSFLIEPFLLSDVFYPAFPFLSLFSGTMRRRRQTTKSREALFSIWYLPCEEGRRSALPEASTPSLRCSRHLETCLSFCDAYTKRTHGRHTARCCGVTRRHRRRHR